MTETATRNWIFLGDSLSEGVGSSRVNFVSELAALLRAQGSAPVDVMRLRRVEPDTFNRFLRVNVAGCLDQQNDPETRGRLWLWNLAAEGTTVQSDGQWLPLIDALRPERIFVLRGALESIVRPAAVADGGWPRWLPECWRHYAALDPKCYFSTTAWRRLKQIVMDRLKQHLRLRLLAARPGRPLLAADELLAELERLLGLLRRRTQKLYLIGLPPVSSNTFPGSRQAFMTLNEALEKLAADCGADFIDSWTPLEADPGTAELFYLDGFHPNRRGARALAQWIQAHLHPVAADQ